MVLDDADKTVRIFLYEHNLNPKEKWKLGKYKLSSVKEYLKKWVDYILEKTGTQPTLGYDVI